MIALHQVQKRRKLALALGGLLIIGLLAIAQPLWRPEGWITEGLKFVGLLLILLCIVGRCWCALYIGGKKTHELVMDGPYAMSRNPLYVFSILGAAGIGLTAGSLTGGLLVGGAVWLVFRSVVLREEAFLGQAFGAAYAEYCARVPRFWPDFSLRQPLQKHILVDLPLLARTLRDALPFLLALPIFKLIEGLRAAGWPPVLMMLP